jgi:integrase
MTHEWKSALGAQIKGFIEAKRLAGYKYEKQARFLRHFDDYCYIDGIGGCNLIKEDVEGFCYGVYYEKPGTIRDKEIVLHDFGQYLQNCGGKAYVCQKKTKIQTSRHIPYIYSECELAALFRVIDEWPYQYQVRPNRRFYPLLFRLLYGCGMRLSEALHLKVSDVDIREGTLLISQSKNDMTRMIPMAESLRLRCLDYTDNTYLGGDLFFPSPLGGAFDKSTIYRKFREFLWAAGIHHTENGPRIHDFRHTYCVHCMKSWVLAGKDVQNLQPYLMTYMGHADFRGTEYYLRLTSDLYPDIVEKCEAALGWLIPERGEPNDD